MFQPFLRFYLLTALDQYAAELKTVSTLLEILLLINAAGLYMLFREYVFQPFLRFY